MDRDLSWSPREALSRVTGDGLGAGLRLEYIAGFGAWIKADFSAVQSCGTLAA
jgi:hypothetical protein